MSAATLPPTLNSQEKALVQYRTISRSALLALGLGLASALVLVNPLLAPIPLTAVVVAVLSLRGIRAGGGQVLGRTPAVVGLCLATFFLGWGVAARFGRALTLEAHARRFAESWLQLVADGDLQQADQLRKPAHSRLRTAAGRQEFYEQNPDGQANLTTFFETSPLREFIAQGKQVKFQFAGLGSIQRSAYYDELVLNYTFRGADSGSGSLFISVKRTSDEGHVDWQVDNVTGGPDSEKSVQPLTPSIIRTQSPIAAPGE